MARVARLLFPFFDLKKKLYVSKVPNIINVMPKRAIPSPLHESQVGGINAR
jgi:hypothetical protein